MSKMSTELTRHALNGATMGTRWSALFFAEPEFDPAPIRTAVGKFGGSLSSMTAGALGAVILKALMERTGIDPAMAGVDDD